MTSPELTRSDENGCEKKRAEFKGIDKRGAVQIRGEARGTEFK